MLESLKKATSQPFLTQTTAPLSDVSLSPQTNLNHLISTVATSIASSDTKTLHGNPSIKKDFPSIIVEPSTSLQPSPFPLHSFITYCLKLLTFEEQLSYGQYAPAYFSPDSWMKIWNSRKVNLDDLSSARCCKLRNLNCRVPHPSDMKRNSPGTSIVWQLTQPNATPAYAFNAAPLLTLPTLTLHEANMSLIHASLYTMDSRSFLSTTANVIRDSLPPTIFTIIISFLPFCHHTPQTWIPRSFNCH